ncbi:hypothetical protein MN116_002537 [Schistosoma mekongi]|uniref:Rho-GAP domain-containing protein n=1 Tax=Schistosoma mekongi TaxID=38744 RepID=A0AAE1ZKD9_SCHME|nr:hypothetical protein MN116_002537 [Schistosoma mekongi]
MSSNLNQKSSKLSKSGFKGLSRSKKHRKRENDRNEEVEKHSNTLNNLPITTTSTTTSLTSLSPNIQDSLCNKSIKKKSINMQNSANLLQTINDNCDNDKIASSRDIGSFLKTPTSTTLNEHSTNNVLSNKSKRKAKRKEEKQSKYSTTTTDLIVTNSQNSSVKNKKKRGLKLHSHKSALMMEQPTKSVNKPIFGVPLEVACSRNPSHDGIILPAFFRHCIDYIEQHGLSSEGIYRVPGVHSQVQAVISAIDNGIEFPDIPPTSATFYCDEVNLSRQQRISNFLVGSDSSSKGKIRHLSSSHSKLKENSSSNLSHKTIDSRSINIPKPNNLITNTFCAKTPNSGSGNSPMIQSPTLLTSSTSPQLSTTTTTTASLPHDPAVIASVVKHFLRSLPESILTKRLSNVIESLTTDNVQFYHNLSVLIHQELPVSNRYLLAWIIQHMMHIIDRAGENRMTLANIIIVLSPCLGISHRLLGILLNPTPPKDFSLDLCKLDAKLPAFNVNNLNIDPSTWHWLFPHPIYLLKSYIPPLKLIHDLELPDSNEELDIEFKKQESLLAYLCEQIQLGDELNSDKEYLLRDVQHIMTEIKRRKTLTNPDAIRQEIIKQQAQLDRLHKAITQNTNIINANNITNTASTVGVDVCSDTSSGLSQSKDNVGCNQRRRVTGTDKHSKNHRHHVPDEKIPYSDELWEVQRQLTMLKRKLKQYEKSNELRQCQQQLPSIMTNSDTSPPTLEIDESKSNYPCVLFMSGAPLIIPSISELDQEEVLNLTLRKLPIESIVSSTNLPTTSNNVCSKTLDNNLHHNDDKMTEIHQISTSTIFSHTEITTLSKSVETTNTTTLENVRNECTCKQDGDINNRDGAYSREDALKQIEEALDINTIVKDENDHKQPLAQEDSTMTVGDNNEKSVHHSQNQQEGLTIKSHQMSNTYNQVAENEVKSHEGVLRSVLSTTPTETNDQKIHDVFSNQSTLILTTATTTTTTTTTTTVATSSSISPIHPSEIKSTVNNSYYFMNDSPSLPPPSDLAPKLSEFIESSTKTSENDINQRQIMYYKARKQELIAIQTDLQARIRSENAEISRLQSCINHLLESGGKRAKRIYRTYITAKQLCPPWLSNQNPFISTPQYTANSDSQSNYTISQPWTKIAERLTTVKNDDIDDDDEEEEEDHSTASSMFNKKEECLLSEHSIDCNSHRRHLHSDDDNDGDGDDDSDSLEEPILTNRDSSPDSVAYSRLTEEDGDINTLQQNVHLTEHNEIQLPKDKFEVQVNEEDNDTDDDDDDEGNEEEYDDDDDENECELELATTLHQLTLDNARLEQLNARSLEAIQVERNRCADLKVLLKLRHHSYINPISSYQ